MKSETLGELPVIFKPVPILIGTSEWSQTVGLNRQDKAAVIEEVSGIVANAGSIVIAEYRGLSVQAVTQLRANARKEGVQLRVLKNTLVRRAVTGTPFEVWLTNLSVPLFTVFPLIRLLLPRC